MLGTEGSGNNKSIMFFSTTGSERDITALFDMKVYDILISYFYVKKRPKYVTEFVLPEIKKNNGHFMIDSGAFSMRNTDIGKGDKAIIKDYDDPESYNDFINEYVQWINDHIQYIYCAANMDMDNFVGRDVVVEWNEKYFRPLESRVNVIYNVLKDYNNWYSDLTGLKRLEEYCKMYDYVGVNQDMKDYDSKIYQCIKRYKKRIHGFAWTAVEMVKEYPFFSIDSSTWLGGARYGTSYRYDGKNFRVMDYKHKYYRKADKILCREYGVDYDKVLRDDTGEINKYNLIGWLGARKEIIKMGNLRLNNNTVDSYAKACGI